jgi:hypothetical protein
VDPGCAEPDCWNLEAAHTPRSEVTQRASQSCNYARQPPALEQPWKDPLARKPLIKMENTAAVLLGNE